VSDTPPDREGEDRRGLLQLLVAYRWRLVGGVLLLLLTNGLDKAIPWLLQHAVDALKDGALGAVRDYAFVVIGIAAVMWIIRTASRIVVFNVGRDIEYHLRNQLLARLHLLGPSFFRRMATGDIMSRATNDLGQVRLLVGFGVLHVVNSVFAYVGAVALMIALSPELTLWAMVPVPLFVIATRRFSRALFARSREQQRALAKLSDRAQETLTGIRLVRAFAIEDHAERRFEESNQEALRTNMRLVKLRGLMWPVLMTLSSIGTLIVI